MMLCTVYPAHKMWVLSTINVLSTTLHAAYVAFMNKLCVHCSRRTVNCFEIVHSTAHISLHSIAHFRLHSIAHLTLHSIAHLTLHSVHITVYSVHCTVHNSAYLTLHCTLYISHCQCTPYMAHCTVDSAGYLSYPAAFLIWVICELLPYRAACVLTAKTTCSKLRPSPMEDLYNVWKCGN